MHQKFKGKPTYVYTAIMNTIQMYDAQACTIKIEDIATNVNNRIVLERMRRNNANDCNNSTLYIQNQHDEDGYGCVDYVPEGAHDMGWLGYFVGKNEHLKDLVVKWFTPTSGSTSEVLEPFFKGLSRNRSLSIIQFTGIDLLGGRVFTMMDPFFNINTNINHIKIDDCNFGEEGGRLFALALASSTNSSLKSFMLDNNSIEGDVLVDIITSLSMHPHLNGLYLIGDRLSINGCTALSTLLQHSVTQLQHIDLSNNEINDEGMEVLVPALKNCSRLKDLKLCSNPQVTNKGWQHLASILEAPNSNITELNLYGSNIDDDALTAFANALVNNKTLTMLHLNGNQAITERGWQSLSNLLCDTSSVNATFLSNHTLQHINTKDSLRSLIELNKTKDKKEVAMIKIVRHHNVFDMMPFFEWEFKVLPLMIHWFEKASLMFRYKARLLSNIKGRKFSCIYQFVRGMPVLYVKASLKKELDDIKAELSQMEGESTERKQQLERREMSITERLGPQRSSMS